MIPLLTANLMIDGPAGTYYKASKTGWITEEIFVEWLVHFKEKVNASTDNPVLLIFDNHELTVRLKHTITASPTVPS